MLNKRRKKATTHGLIRKVHTRINNKSKRKTLPSSLRNILSDIPKDELISVIYYSIRLLHRRDLILNVSEGLIVPGLSGEPDESAQNYAGRIIRCIEKIEGVRLQDLSDETSDSYIISLSMHSNPLPSRWGNISPAVKRQLELLNHSMRDLNAYTAD